MAKDTEKAKERQVAKSSEPEARSGSERQQAASNEAKQPSGADSTSGSVQIDDSRVAAHYANFCRVSSSPEELVLDLGLNPNPYQAAQTIKVSQRIILNHFTAKRLLSALSMAVQRHEQAFGVVETDVRKRVRSPQ